MDEFSTHIQRSPETEVFSQGKLTKWRQFLHFVLWTHTKNMRKIQIFFFFYCLNVLISFFFRMLLLIFHNHFDCVSVQCELSWVELRHIFNVNEVKWNAENDNDFNHCVILWRERKRKVGKNYFRFHFIECLQHPSLLRKTGMTVSESFLIKSCSFPSCQILNCVAHLFSSSNYSNN